MGIFYSIRELERFHVTRISATERPHILEVVGKFTSGIVPVLLHFIENDTAIHAGELLMIIEKEGSEKMMNFLLLKFPEQHFKVLRKRVYLERTELVKLQQKLGVVLKCEPIVE